MLGEQAVKGKRDRDVIMVGRREGRFTRLMLVVEDSDLEVHSMEVVFAGGDRFNPRLRHVFREEDRTRPIDLPGNSRAIERIEFRYGNLPGGGAARVQVWAREGGGHVGRDDDRRPPPPPDADPRSGARRRWCGLRAPNGAVGTRGTYGAGAHAGLAPVRDQLCRPRSTHMVTAWPARGRSRIGCPARACAT